MSDANVVGSAAFELRATKSKIGQDLEDARRVILEASKRTEAELAEIIGTGTDKGNRKAAESFQAPKAAGIEAGAAIRESMRKAGEEIGEAVAKGSAKAKAELEQVAQKAREVQQVKLPTPTAPTEATHNLVTNPTTGAQGWVPKGLGELGDGRDARMGAATSRQAEAQAKWLSENKAKSDALKESLKDIEPSAASGAEGLGKVSVGSVATAASIGALIGGAILVTKSLWDMGRAAMQSAGEIADSSNKVGLSTDALQEWRYVAIQTGADAKTADQAIGAFGEKLASAAAKLSKADVNAFSALGLKPDDLKKFKSVEEALDAVIDRISNLKSESDRAAIAEKLGLGPLVVAVRGGAAEIARLRDEAQRLGVVMDAELVRRGAEAQAQFQTLSRVIDVQLKSAFIDLAPAIVAAIKLVAQLAADLGSVLDQWRDLDQKTLRGLQTERQKLTTEKDAIASQFGTRPLNGQVVEARRIEGGNYTVLPAGAAARAGALPFGGGVPRLPSAGGFDWTLGFSGAPRPSFTDAGQHFDAITKRTSEIDARIADLNSRNTPPTQSNRPTGTSLIPTPGRPNREAEREARRAERIEQEIYRAKQRLLQVAERDILTAQQRYDLNQDQIAMERAARDAEIESKTTRGEIKAAERTRLDLANKEADALEDRILADVAFRDIQDERIANERMLADLTANLLSLQSAGARTAAERQRIELQLLAITQKQRRDALQLQLERNPSLTKADRDAAMAQNARVEKEEAAAVVRNNLSPLAAWRDQSLKNAAEISQALENISARGLDSLNDGIVDAIMNTRSLGEVFGSVSKQILADLLSISVRRGITEPLAAMLFGDGKTSGGAAGSAAGGASWLKTAFSLGKRMFGFSDGGYTGNGGKFEPAGIVHKGEYVLPQEVVARIGTARLDALRLGSLKGFANGGLVGSLSAFPSPPSLLSGLPALGGHGGVQAARGQQVFDMRGALTTADLLAEVNQKVSAGTATAIRSSTTIARKGAASIQQSQRRLGTS
ncbi:hypothetical protein [Brevundimonas nasdae]|uniref:hypothetical protein n=1 Tax=Brevundimonas nasdae TaxID=172043 RepID=UPI002899A3FB|nr:hypothetical protein [Brevundimonas nasdae]